jgi:hypothetical protein
VNEGEWVIEAKPEAAPPATNYGTTQSATASAMGSRQLVLTSAEATSPAGGSPLMIGSRPTLDPNFQRGGAGGALPTGSMPYLAVSPSDAEELADILSIGSRVMIRR